MDKGLFQFKGGRLEVHPVKMNGRKLDPTSFPDGGKFLTASAEMGELEAWAKRLNTPISEAEPNK